MTWSSEMMVACDPVSTSVLWSSEMMVAGDPVSTSALVGIPFTLTSV